MRTEKYWPLWLGLAMTGHFICTPALAGDSTVITLRTLAEIQQLQDEMNLRDRIDSLQQRRSSNRIARATVGASNTTDPALALPTHFSTQASVNTDATLKAVAATPARKATIRRPTLKLLSVYGPTQRLNAEAVDSTGELKALEARDRIGPWVVSQIRQEGLLLHREQGSGPTDKGIFLAVGESMDDGGRP